MLFSLNQSLSRLLNNRFNHFFNTTLQRQQYGVSHTRRHTKNMKTLMTIFDGGAPTSLLHFLPQFVKKCDMETKSHVQACRIKPSFPEEDSFHHFLASRNVSLYSGLHYWSKCVYLFHSTYSRSSDSCHEVMQLKILKQLFRETEV